MRRFALPKSWILAVVLAAVAGSPALAQNYPSRAIRTIVPYQAGTGGDIAARYVADALGKSLGQSFFVENRVGANGNIGTAAAAKAAPDGYTLLAGAATLSMNPHLYQSPGYDPEADFEPIALVAQIPMLFAANASVPIATIPELIAAAKARPNELNVAHPSVTALITLEYLKLRGGAPLFGIPYKSNAPALADVAGGQVPLIVDSIASILPFITSGKMRAIAVTTLGSTELLPGVKSVAEQGLAGFEFAGWIGFFAPKGTPPQAVNLINAEITRLLADPAVRKRILDFGMQPVAPGSPKQFADFFRADREKWGQMIKAAKITPQ